MRTISNRLVLRLLGQANEADIRQNHKLAECLTKQLEKHAHQDLVRGDDADYKYSRENLLEDINNSIWDILIRVSDFYDILPDREDIEEVVQDVSNDVLNTFESLFPNNNIGAHEPPVHGEDADAKDHGKDVLWEGKVELEGLDEDLPDEENEEDDEVVEEEIEDK